MANLLLARSGKQQGGFHKREGEREREKALARVVRTEKCERENSAAGIKSNLCLA